MKHLVSPQYVAFSYTIAKFAPTAFVGPRDNRRQLEETSALLDDAFQKNVYKQPRVYNDNRQLLSQGRQVADDAGEPFINPLTPNIQERMKATTINNKVAARRQAFDSRDAGALLDSLSFKPSTATAGMAGLNNARLRGLLGGNVSPTPEDVSLLESMATKARALQGTVNEARQNSVTGKPSTALETKAARMQALADDIKSGNLPPITPKDVDPSNTRPSVIDTTVSSVREAVSAPKQAVSNVIDDVDNWVDAALPRPAAAAPRTPRVRREGPRVGDLIPGAVKNAGNAFVNSASDVVDRGRGLLDQSPEIAEAFSGDKRRLLAGAGLLGTGAAVLGGNAIAGRAQQRELERQQQLEAVRNIGVY